LFAATTSAGFGLMGTGGMGTGVSMIGAGGSKVGFETFSVVRGAAVWAGAGSGAGTVAALTGIGTDGIGTEGLSKTGLSAGVGLAAIAGGSAAAASS
jgi:hypothetical protein